MRLHNGHVIKLNIVELIDRVKFALKEKAILQFNDDLLVNEGFEKR